MYAVISTGGKQYRLAPGQVVDVERLPAEAGEQVVFDRVLLVRDGEQIQVGSPLVEGAAVRATVVQQYKDDKVVVFKFKRRKMYRRKNGHRQLLTQVRVDEIVLPGAGAAGPAVEEAVQTPQRSKPTRKRKSASAAESKVSAKKEGNAESAGPRSEGEE